MSDFLQLEEAVKEGGIRSVNFFNGRLLASKDLTREQTARRESDWRLGLALGDGVAFGLDVSLDQSPPKDAGVTLRITSGLAINRKGQTLRLSSNTSVALSRRFDGLASDCTFVNCEEIRGGTYIQGAGVYVLTIAPAEVTEGKAPTNGLDPTNVRCNTDATIEALRFRLHTVKPAQYAGLDAGQAWFRNALAYRCFGADVQPNWLDSLGTARARRESLLDSLRPISLSDYDVPLALISISGVMDITFIDEWSVRRPLSRESSTVWASLVDDRRLAVGQAMFMQFQRQIFDSAPPAGNLAPMTARSHFKYLPAAGVIPVPEEQDQTTAPATRFFAGMTYRGPAFINAARVEGLLRESLCYPPIETQTRELVWLYRVRENRMAIDTPPDQSVRRSYLVFASGHIPYRADAQFDLAHWNYGNYALAP